MTNEERQCERCEKTVIPKFTHELNECTVCHKLVCDNCWKDYEKCCLDCVE